MKYQVVYFAYFGWSNLSGSGESDRMERFILSKKDLHNIPAVHFWLWVIEKCEEIEKTYKAVAVVRNCRYFIGEGYEEIESQD